MTIIPNQFSKDILMKKSLPNMTNLPMNQVLYNQIIRMNVVITFKERKRQTAPVSVGQRDCICGQ